MKCKSKNVKLSHFSYQRGRIVTVMLFESHSTGLLWWHVKFQLKGALSLPPCYFISVLGSLWEECTHSVPPPEVRLTATLCFSNCVELLCTPAQPVGSSLIGFNSSLGVKYWSPTEMRKTQTSDHSRLQFPEWWLFLYYRLSQGDLVSNSSFSAACSSPGSRKSVAGIKGDHWKVNGDVWSAL